MDPDELEFLQRVTIRYNSHNRTDITVEQQVLSLRSGGKVACAGNADDFHRMAELQRKYEHT